MTASNDGQKWYNRSGQSEPNDTEVLFFALLVAGELRTQNEMKKWSTKVLLERERAYEEKESWKPLGEDQWGPPVACNVSALFGPLYSGYFRAANADWTHIGVAIQAWDGDGQCDGLTSHKLREHRNKNPDGQPAKGGKTRAPRRWKTWSVMRVAALVKQRAGDLQRALKLDAPLAEIPSAREALRALEAENARLEARCSSLEADRDLARNALRHRDRRVAQSREKAKAAAQRRADKNKLFLKKLKAGLEAVAKKKLQVSLAAQTARLEAEYAERLEKMRLGLNTARAKKRQSDNKAKAVKRTAARQQQKRETESQQESETSEDEAPAPRRLPFELLPRRGEHGRWQAEAVEIRSLRWAQLARGVAPNNISANIQDVLALVAPELEVPASCDRQSHLMRGEVTLAGEAMAAWKFAACKRVLCFGWDESTKFGNAVLSCNFQIEHHDGSRDDVCLRGLSILPEGGKSKEVLAHLEKRILAYSRRMLMLWAEEHDKRLGSGSWAAAGAPSHENIGLHRLAEDTVLMTDTCNSARCTRRLLLKAVVNNLKETVGAAAWDAMTDEERNTKYKTYTGDCFQHLRNIIIDAMAAKGNEFIKGVLSEDLSQFSAFERIEVDGSSVIRSAFKQFHHGGEYAKGRGREFTSWRKKEHRQSAFIPFARAMGSRQDLAFDGCVPLFWNRLVCVEFLRGYIDCPKSENVLDKSLYTLLRCNDFVALVRVNTLWKYVFSEPLRWLTGKCSKIDGWSMYKLSWVLDLVEKAMEEIVADPEKLLDPDINIFAPVAEEVTEFAEWQKEQLEATVAAEDGTDIDLVRAVLSEARAPAEGTGNHQATARTLELAKVQAERALEKLKDPKLALADKLTSQDGANSFGKNADAHARTRGVHATNDAVENKFATADYVMRTYRGVSVLNTSGIVQQRSAHDFDRPLKVLSDRRKRKRGGETVPVPDGFFWSGITSEPVSYTHLTLPTKRIV